MRKRKNDEQAVSLNQIGLLAMGLGIVALIAFSGAALWWLTGTSIPWRSDFQKYAYPTRIPYNPTSYVRAPAATTMPTYVPAMRMDDARFVISTVDGEILTNADGTGARSTGLRGEDVTVSPDGNTLAYLRGKDLYIFRAGNEQIVAGLSGPAVMPAWSADGDTLAFVVREASADVVYRLNLEAMQPFPLIRVPEIAAPPLANPATGRLLIAERLETRKTVFYTIDPNCATDSACRASRKDVATISHSVGWAAYHPSATAIAFADRDDGNIYLLNTASGDISPLADESGYKRRPAFSKDGRWLAYVTDGNYLYVKRLDDGSTHIVTLGGVASADWAK